MLLRPFFLFHPYHFVKSLIIEDVNISVCINICDCVKIRRIIFQLALAYASRKEVKQTLHILHANVLSSAALFPIDVPSTDKRHSDWHNSGLIHTNIQNERNTISSRYCWSGRNLGCCG